VKFIIATAAMALMASTAMAADLIVEDEVVVDVPAAAYDWSGAYVGVNAGFAGLSADAPGYYGVYYGDYYDGDGRLAPNGTGGLAGVGAGAQAQFGSFVLGIEGDIDWAWLDGSENYYEDYYESHASWNWLATLRARAGVAVDSLLLYGTVGVAAVNAEYGSCYYADCDPAYTPYDYTESVTQFGIVAGVGAEVMVTDNVSIKAEALYVGLPDETFYTPAGDYEATFSSSAVVARAGINLHF
jgi:outer membrane immunogenic protein